MAPKKAWGVCLASLICALSYGARATRRLLNKSNVFRPEARQRPGAAVTLVGLTTASLNGETGWVAQALDGATGRIAVRLKPLSTVRVVLVKPSNLERDWGPEYDIKEA